MECSISAKPPFPFDHNPQTKYSRNFIVSRSHAKSLQFSGKCDLPRLTRKPAISIITQEIQLPMQQAAQLRHPHRKWKGRKKQGGRRLRGPETWEHAGDILTPPFPDIEPLVSISATGTRPGCACKAPATRLPGPGLND
ncbi:hypothetical protein CEXT_309321 [Caerostris extrusa]|uniref:Uncharacterized protein n=1 Tax=Caerostris extrusa TaxID=172846 RepID=A0AAV4R8E5_CAEEX|nr:hypothetical protein CEXT_309321 [Caerostris extrusa]